MEQETFHLFLWVMSGIALLVFIALYFVKAGYGIFRTPSWGWSINNKAAWVLMESPVFIVMLALWACSGVGVALPQFLFLLLFLLHYFQRSFVFPFLMKGKSKMPVAIMAMVSEPHALIGLLLFFIGMGINLHSDHVIRTLRKPGDTRHYLPQRGMYRYVTSANYFGELVEWTGFAVLTASPAAWVFVWWTAANLVPRANAIYHRYCDEFGTKAVGKRKRIIPYIY